MTVLAYSMGLTLSKKYFEVIIHCLEPKIFNHKVKVLFNKIKNRIKPNISD